MLSERFERLLWASRSMLMSDVWTIGESAKELEEALDFATEGLCEQCRGTGNRRAGCFLCGRNDLHHYVIARTDVPTGVMAAQIVHAAGESSDRVPSGVCAVCLAAHSELELEDLEAKLIELEIAHTSIREPDAPWNGALMAIGLEPVIRDRHPKLRRALARFKLIGENKWLKTSTSENS